MAHAVHCPECYEAGRRELVDRIETLERDLDRLREEFEALRKRYITHVREHGA